MLKLRFLVKWICIVVCPTFVLAQKGDVQVSANPFPHAMLLSGPDFQPVILTDERDAEVVQIAAAAVSDDIGKITGKPARPIHQLTGNNPAIIIAGTLGKNKWIDELAKQHPSIDTIRGKWETFTLLQLSEYQQQKNVIVIVGSDPRGTAFGLFELSRKMGVQPFYWWADIVPEQHPNIFISIPKPVVQSPSVQYRGFFINDEDWGINPWAAKNMDTDIKDIGPRTYEKMFELMLRLKANYLWPAMHRITKAFWYYKENPELARRYDIVLGASHCEPMLRNNVFEWVSNYESEYGEKPKEWRYDLNKEQISKYWDDRVKASVHTEAVYTIGMRGIHDGKMPGPETLEGKKELLNQVIADQRVMLKNNLSKPAADVPQIFCPYKEVLDIYQLGMDLPDDITIAWADDNHGYIRQVSNPAEQKRKGRSGVYYHLSYFGKPADYLWLSSISPSLMSYELTKAYRFGADKLWVFNVGDIKPAEMEIQFAMDLAWNINSWKPEHAHGYANHWATEVFGEKFSHGIASIKNEYYRLAAGGKPEHLNKVSFSSKDIEERLSSYNRLAQQVDSVEQLLPNRLKDAYFQLVKYPVLGAKLMNEKILDYRRTGNRNTANQAYDAIQNITQQYNTKIAGGKWNGMMDASPRKQAVFNRPDSVTDLKDKANRPEKISDAAIIISAAAFNKKITPVGDEIKLIEGLGINGKGIIANAWKAYSIDKPELMPSTAYKINVTGENITVQVKCLPTFKLYDGLQLRYGISVNGDAVQWVNIETKADTDEWSKNVLRGYAAGVTKHIVKDKIANIRIYFPDAGLVLNSIEIQ